MCFFNLNPKISRVCYGWKSKSTTKLIQTLWIQLGNDSFIIVYVERPSKSVFVILIKRNTIPLLIDSVFLCCCIREMQGITSIWFGHFILWNRCIQSQQMITFYCGVGWLWYWPLFEMIQFFPHCKLKCNSTCLMTLHSA